MTISHHQQAPIPVLQGIPHTRGLDSTFRLLAEGYRFFPRRYELLGSDIFATRLMGRRAVCVRGAEAARMFYQPGRFTRRHAIPPTTLMLLQDYGSANWLDGAEHRHRKAMWMSLQTPDSRARMVETAAALWRARFARWKTGGPVVLFQETESLLCEAACRWAGVPAAPDELARLTRECSAMIDGAGSAGPRNWRGLLLRTRTERWARALIEAVRAGALAAPPDSALAVIARYRDRDEQPLSTAHAGVELLNALRPVVAVARYIVFGALALHEFPEWRARLASGDERALAMFAQEVRRYYPFFTAIGGRACEDFAWKGLQFEQGAWVLLDLYGSNHHPASWQEPQRFRPERFADWQGNGFDLVPQGGGDYLGGHRCPGEMVTVELIKSALHLMASELAYQVPRQDLRVDLGRMPTLPASGFILQAGK